MGKVQKVTNKDLPIITYNFFVHEFGKCASRNIKKEYLREIHQGHTGYEGNVRLIKKFSGFFKWIEERSYEIDKHKGMRYDRRIIPLENGQSRIKYIVNKGDGFTEGVILSSNGIGDIEAIVSKLSKFGFSELSSENFEEKLRYRHRP